MRTESKRVGLALSASAFAAFALAGCGASNARVSGNVTVDGRPIKFGTILFVGPAGTSVSARINDGAYEAVNVPVGQVRIAVEGFDTNPFDEPPRPRQKRKPEVSVVPPKYRDAEKSGLTLMVNAGDNERDVDLK
jgi:hypothetical protein